MCSQYIDRKQSIQYYNILLPLFTSIKPPLKRTVIHHSDSETYRHSEYRRTQTDAYRLYRLCEDSVQSRSLRSVGVTHRQHWPSSSDFTPVDSTNSEHCRAVPVISGALRYTVAHSGTLACITVHYGTLWHIMALWHYGMRDFYSYRMSFIIS